MFGIGSSELLLVLVVIFLVYGPDRLPEMAQKLGKVVRDVRKAGEDVKQAVARQIDLPQVTSEKKEKKKDEPAGS